MLVSEGLEIPPEPIEIREQILGEAGGGLERAHALSRNRLPGILHQG